MTYSSEDFERFYLHFKAEAMPRGTSIQALCSLHNVLYNAFDKHITLLRHFSDVHHITVRVLPEPKEIRETLFHTLDKLDELYETR